MSDLHALLINSGAQDLSKSLDADIKKMTKYLRANGARISTLKWPTKREVLLAARENLLSVPRNGEGFIYFTGHGSKKGMCCKDGVISISELLFTNSVAERYSGKSVVIWKDACYATAEKINFRKVYETATFAPKKFDLFLVGTSYGGQTSRCDNGGGDGTWTIIENIAPPCFKSAKVFVDVLTKRTDKGNEYLSHWTYPVHPMYDLTGSSGQTIVVRYGKVSLELKEDLKTWTEYAFKCLVCGQGYRLGQKSYDCAKRVGNCGDHKLVIGSVTTRIRGAGIPRKNKEEEKKEEDCIIS